jgi:nucleotide-binding universal stress UspA family protein
MFTSIMVALDGSPQANDALSAASAMANLTGGNLHLITVPQRILVPAMDGMMTYPLPFDQEEMVRSGKEI